MSTKINTTVLMSGADYFEDTFAINALMDSNITIDKIKATKEHKNLETTLTEAGIKVIKVTPPVDAQDGVYTANWGLTRGNKVILSSLPNKRKSEEPYAKSILGGLGLEVIDPPYNFSGQGDALPCGNLLFCGSHYRTDPRMHDFIADTLGYEVIGLQAVPQIDDHGQEVINNVTGWPDSFFYDIDLAIAVLRDGLIAWCPDAFLPESQEKIRALQIDKIEVSLEEATKGFCCNLISTGETVIMSNNAPNLQRAVEEHGLKTVTPSITELCKGGGFIRCTSLTLDNT
jgi:N-dimethylarginine dimethylaminohydrolase